MAEVQLESVCKRYGAVTAVERVDLTVAKGELLVLVGPSGCGKTTTLRMIAGLESITEGTIRIDGRVVNDVAPKDRDIAMVFQSYALYPHMSVRENMSFALQLARTPKAEIARRVDEAAEILGITELLARKPGQLSGGQRQRVAMGRAIVRKPRVFLFDEPLSNLDAKLRVQMRIEIARLHRELGATIVYVTHDQVEAMTLADRLVVMQGGRVQQIGAPMEVFDRPVNRAVAEFIGSPSMNLLPGRWLADEGRVEGAGWRCALPEGRRPVGPSADVLLGVRPQHLRLLVAGADGGACLVFEAVLDVVEPTGAEAFLYFDLAGAPLVGRCEGALPAVGERVRLGAAVEHLHLFDAAGGRRLAVPE